MNVFQITIIMMGLFLDSFIVMMQKGATLQKLERKTSFLYGGVFSFVSLVALIIGYGIGFLFDASINAKGQFALASFLIFALGIFFGVKAIRKTNFEEHRDGSFSYKSLFILACLCSVDLLVMGVCFSLLNVSFVWMLLSALVICWVTTIVALSVGYCYGARFQRGLMGIGSVLLIIMSLYIVFSLVLR